MAQDDVRTTMAFFRLQTPVLRRPSWKWGQVLNDPGKEDVFASVEMEDLVRHMVTQGPAGVHREIIPFEYSATGTSIACATTRFRESERADLGSMSVRAHAEPLGRGYSECT